MSIYNKTLDQVWKEKALELVMDDADLHIEATNNMYLEMEKLLGFKMTEEHCEALDAELAKHGYHFGDHDVPVQCFITLARKVAE